VSARNILQEPGKEVPDLFVIGRVDDIEYPGPVLRQFVIGVACYAGGVPVEEGKFQVFIEFEDDLGEEIGKILEPARAFPEEHGVRDRN